MQVARLQDESMKNIKINQIHIVYLMTFVMTYYIPPMFGYVISKITI